MKHVSRLIADTRRIPARLQETLSHHPISRNRWMRCAALVVTVTIVQLSGLCDAIAQDTSGAASNKLLVFRNIPSWNRSPDFEDACRTLKLSFDVKSSSEMKTAKMSNYRVIVIPGAQWETSFYADFARNAQAFDQYVQDGGVLVFELNGAEREGITVPGGATMVRHAGTDNLIVMPEHPAVAPLAKKPRITANLASHGYLAQVPANALILATVVNERDDTADKGKPTYVEYSRGKGRIIAACQCFHDQDGSGRGPLMPAVLAYAMAGKWYSPK